MDIEAMIKTRRTGVEKRETHISQIKAGIEYEEDVIAELVRLSEQDTYTMEEIDWLLDNSNHYF